MSYSYRGGAIGWGKKNSSSQQQAPLEQDVSDSDGTTRRVDLFGIGVLKWINVIAYVANVVVTYGVGMYGTAFGLSTNATISAKYQTLVTPAGWAFAIWSIIFVGQAAWVLQQFCISRSSTNAKDAVEAVGYRYLTTVITQCAWTISFAKENIIWSFALMLLIWINLLSTVRVLDTLRVGGDRQASNCTKVKDYVLQILPFAVHFGWISAATVVNTNVLLVQQQVSTTGLYGAAIGSLVFILLLGIVLVCRSGYLTAPLVLVWALVGIAAELANPQESIVNTFSASQIYSIQSAAIAVAVLLLLGIIVQAVRQYRKSKSKQEEEAVHLRKEERGAPVYYRAPY